MPWTALLEAASTGDEATAEELVATRPEFILIFDENGRSVIHFAARGRLLSLVEKTRTVLREHFYCDDVFLALCRMAACFAADRKPFSPLSYLEAPQTADERKLHTILSSAGNSVSVHLDRCAVLGYSREAADAALQQVPALRQLVEEKLVTPFLEGTESVVYQPRTEQAQLDARSFAFAGALPPLAFKYYLAPMSDGHSVGFPDGGSSMTVWHGPTHLANIEGIAKGGFAIRKGDGNHPCPNVLYFSRTSAVPCIAYAPHIVTMHPSRDGTPRTLHWRVVITARLRRRVDTPVGHPSGADGKVLSSLDDRPGCSKDDLHRSMHEQSTDPPAGYADPETVVSERQHWNYTPMLPHYMPGLALDNPSMELWVKDPKLVITTGVVLVPWPASPDEPAGLGKPFHGNTEVYDAVKISKQEAAQLKLNGMTLGDGI